PEEFEQAQRSESRGGEPVSKLDVSLTVRQVVRLPSFYLLVTGFSLLFVVLPGLTLHMIPYFTDRGLSDGVAVTVVSVYAAGGGLGSLIYGLVAERYSIRLTLATGLLLMAAGFVPLLAVHSPVPAILWGAYHGLIGGGMFTLQQIVFADYYGRESLGAIRGIVWPVQMGANATGPIIAAVAFDVTGSYTLIFSVFGILVMIASLCVFLARPPVGLAHPTPKDVRATP
ncbi:MAG: MFS transporter, partial [Chloroflexi bacterium]|nr:MFS transporter [Chloroflexota bacterium]